MMRTQAGLSAKVVLSSIPILFHSIAILFYLNKHFTGMPSSVCFLFITLTFRFFGLGWHVFTAFWKHWWWQNRTWSVRNLPSTLLYLALKGAWGKRELTCCCQWHKVMSLQISPTVMLMLWPLRFECLDTGNRWKKAIWTLAEHKSEL